MRECFKEVNRRLETLEKKKSQNVWYMIPYIGSVGIIFILPVLIGAYLGWWIDGQYKVGGISWTITGIMLGVFVGVYNVYRFFYLRHKRFSEGED